MWKLSDSHHWVMTPHTVYERCRELRVRESRQTAIAFDRKYLNIDTGKLDSDKLQTIAKYSAADMVDDCDLSVEQYLNRDSWRAGKNIFIENQKWFTPKDNNFDEECRRDEIIKRQAQIKIEYENKIAEEMKRIEDKRTNICAVIPNSWRPK
jgi:hypothetical protein